MTTDSRPEADQFRNFPYRKDRFGNKPTTDPRFSWTSFYSGFADELLRFRHNRTALLTALNSLPSELPRVLNDQFADGTSGLLRDICPFTTMGVFNRKLTDQNRVTIAGHLAESLGMREIAAQRLNSLAGIPRLDNRNSWFFPFEYLRDDDHIDSLWQVFADALMYTDNRDERNRASLIRSFDNAVARKKVGRLLTIGLYWIRPHDFVALDSPNRDFIRQSMDLRVPEARPDAETYLDLCEELQLRFTYETQLVHSFPELSLKAWSEPVPGYQNIEPNPLKSAKPVEPAEPVSPPNPQSEPPYSVDHIVADGCFLERSRLETILERWRVKKNLILQGPPGTGKTWLAKKLAFALIGYRSPPQVRPVQFHPNLSYEDFVRGWRPSGATNGGLELVDGPFLEAVKDAKKEPDQTFAVIIEEINRGNPAQIFGEMLTLLEADKRTPSEALALSYPRDKDERVHLPGNLYIVGTMNIADRSLALVDFALRRRFAFVNLEPAFGNLWRSWVSGQCGLGAEFLADIESRMTMLNQTISTDELLGPNSKLATAS